ncbi:hypothetical protein LIER_07105 [Lithospermum erythrorhizon]|uniref:DUF4283 domain-containing protein n=1 Tax=Lithospermum erythrorhizon TaxID=34254 RepID=A0AAV3P7A1_LITER
MEAEIIKNLQACKVFEEESKSLRYQANEYQPERLFSGHVKSMELPKDESGAHGSNGFPAEKDVKRIMQNRPWCFENTLLIMQAWELGLNPRDNPTTLSPFWIHVKGFPSEYYTKDIAPKIAGHSESV